MRFAVTAILAVFIPLHTLAQTQSTPEVIWKEFLQWYRATPSPDLDPQVAYRTKLLHDGIPEEEASRRSRTVGQLAMERTEALEIWFNYIFSQEKPSFRTEPNGLLMATAKGLKPGRALDVAMGQGRNALWLASQGWDVTGFDISGEALAAAKKAAEQRALKIETVKSGWQAFEFGKERWDRIVLSYAFVPIWDPAFVRRLRDSLKKDGMVVFEHFLREGPGSPVPRFIGAPEPNELPRLFLPSFRILHYEDVLAESEWFPRKAQLARLVARKL